MSTLQTTAMKKELIKRELETTPWDGLCVLAKKTLIKSIGELYADEIELKCLDELGFYCGDVIKSAEMLAAHQLVACTSSDVLAYALEALECEYSVLEDKDIDGLYKIFMVPAENAEVDPNVEVDIEDQFIILNKEA